MNNCIKGFKLLVVIIFAACLISGQAPTGAIKGTFLDPQGAAISGAKVTLVLKKEVIREASTDTYGNFSFSALEPGAYEVHVKTSWTDKVFRKAVKITSPSSTQININVSLEPCSEDEDATVQTKITAIDRAEITRELVNLLVKRPIVGTKETSVKIILSKDNISADWLTADQRAQVDLMNRSEIQERTEKSGELYYFTVSEMMQRGNCVGVSLLNNLTVKGQIEDANMAGGETRYEFRKVKGRWIGIAIVSYISSNLPRKHFYKKAIEVYDKAHPEA
jgi:hypothetical protein